MVNVLYPWKHPNAKVLKINEPGMKNKIKRLSSFIFLFLMERLARDRVCHKLVTVRDTHLNRIHKFSMQYLLFFLVRSDFVNHGHSLCFVTAQHCWFSQEQHKRRVTKSIDFKPWMLSNKYFPPRTGRQYASQFKYTDATVCDYRKWLVKTVTVKSYQNNSV